MGLMHGRPQVEGVRPEDVTRVGATWARALAERRPFRSAYRIYTGNGTYERFVSYAEPIEDEARRPLGLGGRHAARRAFRQRNGARHATFRDRC